MGNINSFNRAVFLGAQAQNEEVTFTYCAKSDGHERSAVGRVEVVTPTHVTLYDRVRDNYRVFILDRIRGKVMRTFNGPL